MSTTPPEGPSGSSPGRDREQSMPRSVMFGSGGDLARLPIPGNAEFAVYLLVWIVIAIVWAASDQVGANTFVTLTTVLTFGYLVSRGIAKASRVLEQ